MFADLTFSHCTLLINHYNHSLCLAKITFLPVPAPIFPSCVCIMGLLVSLTNESEKGRAAKGIFPSSPRRELGA